MQSSAGSQGTGKALTTLGKLMLVLSPILFYVVAPWIGWEHFVGKNGVTYDFTHRHVETVTNAVAVILWWICISMTGYAIMLFGKKLQNIPGSSPAQEDRKLGTVLILTIGLAWVLLQINR